jgi:5'-deoxynucleotidase YfbR-like HD superfamily hydrolase
MIAIREAGHTKRCHGTPTIGQQTVAEHSYHVAMLCIELSPNHEPSANLLKAALYHDLPEHVTGDVPSPAKWASQQLAAGVAQLEAEFNDLHDLNVNLTDDEMIILKYADAFELAFYCVDQMMLGNRFVKKMYHSITHYLGNLPFRPQAEIIMDRLQEKYHDATV